MTNDNEFKEFYIFAARVWLSVLEISGASRMVAQTEALFF